MNTIHIRDTYCWAPFLVNWFGRGLVMDDQHGRIKLNLAYHQLYIEITTYKAKQKYTFRVINKNDFLFG